MYPRANITTDLVVFNKALTEVLLIERLAEPFKGSWALPGGFFNPMDAPDLTVVADESIESAALRELQEETFLTFKKSELYFTGYFDEKWRDPRHRTITFAFCAIYDSKLHGKPKAGDDAKSFKWFALNNLPPLAFDHKKIINSAFELLHKNKKQVCLDRFP